MKVITGEMLNSSLGKCIVCDHPQEEIRIGDTIVFQNKTFTIVEIIHSSGPSMKLALVVR